MSRRNLTAFSYGHGFLRSERRMRSSSANKTLNGIYIIGRRSPHSFCRQTAIIPDRPSRREKFAMARAPSATRAAFAKATASQEARMLPGAENSQIMTRTDKLIRLKRTARRLHDVDHHRPPRQKNAIAAIAVLYVNHV